MSLYCAIIYTRPHCTALMLLHHKMTLDTSVYSGALPPPQQSLDCLQLPHWARAQSNPPVLFGLPQGARLFSSNNWNVVTQFTQCLGRVFTIRELCSLLALLPFWTRYLLISGSDGYGVFSIDPWLPPPPPTARSQPGADPYIRPCTHPSQTNHRLWSEILQEFPRRNVRLHSFSR